MSKSIKLDTTKRGLPAIWETGGGLTSGGSATIIAKADGSKPRAVYVRRGGHLACGDHALIAVHQGYYLVRAGVNRGTRSSAVIERIVKTSVTDVNGETFKATAEVEVVNTFSQGEWDRPLDAKLEAAVEVAFRKASIYHCRSAMYIDTSERTPESPEQRKRREAEMAKQDAERARLRTEKAAADAKARAEAEAASRAALPGLLPRLSALVDRIVALREANPNTNYTELTLGDSWFSFGWGLKEILYTDENVGKVERTVAYWEEQVVEKLRKQMARAEFQPQFEALTSRVETLGLTLSFGEEKVNWEGGSYYGGFAYTQEGFGSFVSDLTHKEEEKATKEREEAAAAAAQAERERVAQDAALTEFGGPHRLGGVNNRSAWWVVRPDGSLREPDRTDTHRYDASNRLGEYWQAVGQSELALHYHRADRYDIAHCEVVHRPEVVTPAQLAAAKQIEEEMGASENAFGLDDRLGRLLDRRAVAIEEAMTDLPQPLWPEDGWTLEALSSANGLSLAVDARSWVNHGREFAEHCEGREAQTVYELPAADGVLQVVAYYKWGAWNLNLWWREQTDVVAAPAEADEPAQAETSLADLAAFFNGQRS